MTDNELQCMVLDCDKFYTRDLLSDWRGETNCCFSVLDVRADPGYLDYVKTQADADRDGGIGDGTNANNALGEQLTAAGRGNG